MKRLIVFVITVGLAFLIVGCGSEPETTYGEALNWPSDRLSSSVPELKGVEITNILDTEDGVEIAFDGCDGDKAKAYINSLQNEQWDIETRNDESGKTVTAQKQTELLVFFSSQEGSGSIVYSSTE